jgi:hypothetical protein
MTNLPALREAVAKMTPGTWRVETRECIDVAVARPDWATRDVAVLEGASVDLAGIVALRNAAPALLDEVARLRQEREALRAENIRLHCEVENWKATIETREADLAAAREAVEKAKLQVMAHKTWENEAVAQAGNANLAYNKIRVENQTLRADLAAARAVLDTAEVFHGHGGPSYVTIIVGRDPWQAWKDGQR